MKNPRSTTTNDILLAQKASRSLKKKKSQNARSTLTRNKQESVRVTPAKRGNEREDDSSSKASKKGQQNTGCERQLYTKEEVTEMVAKEVQRLREEEKEVEKPMASINRTSDSSSPWSDVTGVTEVTQKDFKDIAVWMNTNLRNFIKDHHYPGRKFCKDDEMAETVIQHAIEGGRIQIPTGFDETTFRTHFRGSVYTSFSKLRHNAQTLARRNYMGKYIVRYLHTQNLHKR